MNFIKQIFFLIILSAFAAGCNRVNENNESESEVDDIDFCTCVNSNFVYSAGPIINEFLSRLPDDLDDEQQMLELVAWLKSHPCNFFVGHFYLNNIETDPPTGHIFAIFDVESTIAGREGTRSVIMDVSMEKPLKIAKCIVFDGNFEQSGLTDIIQSYGFCFHPYTFIDGIASHLHRDDVFVIKGEALDVYEYGRKIRLIEDLKGNFPENVDKFMAWGGGFGVPPYTPGLEEARSDFLASDYKNKDTLVMLLTNYDKNLAQVFELYTLQGISFLEKPEDYRTFGCTNSVLKLSGDVVTGKTNIFPWDENSKILPWDDFNEIFQVILKTRKP